MMKCLIADYMFDNIETLLSEAGLEPDYRPEITRDELREILPEYEGLIIRSKTRVDEDLLKNAAKLRFVGRAGAGIDNLDAEALGKRKIKIINAPEGNRNALGEHTIGLLLGLMNKLIKADREVRQGIWDREGNRGYELEGKTVALLGYGHMGRSFAKKLKAFDCEVLAYDKYKENFTDSYVREAEMDEVFERADIFSVHIPLTSETRGMVNIDYLNRFRKNIYVLNTARGEVMPLRDICQALDSGKVIGAGLDVLENEKLDQLSPEQQKFFKTLANSDKTILTPHIAGWSFESYEKINKVLVDKIKSEFNGNK